MKKNLFLPVLAVLLGFLCVSSLQAMEIEIDEAQGNGPKQSRVEYCSKKDPYLELEDLFKTALYASKVINEESANEEAATIEDFRAARDIYLKLAMRCLDEATVCAGEVISYKEDATLKDYESLINLYNKSGMYKMAEYYEPTVRHLKNNSGKLILHNEQLFWGNQILPCSWGWGGIKLDKQEGDGATPVGNFPFRRVFYRADRLEKPETCLPLQEITQRDGWCDDVKDEQYNQYVTLPYEGRHEKLWREDHVYDLLLVVGHNDDPVVWGNGSAIFVHLMRPEGTPTEGCVALEIQDLLKVLKECTELSSLMITSPNDLLRTIDDSINISSEDSQSDSL